MAKTEIKSSAWNASEAWVRGASDFGRGRADGCARIALQLFVRCVYALVSPPPHAMRKRLWCATRATLVAAGRLAV